MSPIAISSRATGTMRSWWKWNPRRKWWAGSWPAPSAMCSGRRRRTLDNVLFEIIGELVKPATRVLDLGCGEGELLDWLKEHKHVDGRGVELSGPKVQRA